MGTFVSSTITGLRILENEIVNVVLTSANTLKKYEYMSLISNRFFIESTLVCLLLTSFSFGQTFQWAKQAGNSGWDRVNVVQTDGLNQVYLFGSFEGTVDLDPGPGIFQMTAVDERDAFISKFDSNGNFIWAKQFGDSAFIDETSTMGIDSFGNLYLTGSFLGSVDFDPGTATFWMTSQGMDRDIYILKLDSEGSFVWAKQIGGKFHFFFPTPAHATAIAVDEVGNQYLTGYFDGTIDFDPDPADTFMLTSQVNSTDIFVCKLTTDGELVWAKQFQGNQPHFGGVGYDIAVNAIGEVYTTGTIGGTVDFDPGMAVFNLTPSVPNNTESYLSKLDANGNFSWAKAMGPGEGNALAVNDQGEVYTGGSTPPGYMPRIKKLDTSGQLLWEKELGGNDAQSITLDASGNVYTIGSCFGTNDFDPGQGVFQLSGGNSDAYIRKLDSSGNFVWAGLLSGTDQVWACDVIIDQDNALYVAGYFSQTADFDPSTSIFNLTGPASGYNLFVTKLSQDSQLGLTSNELHGRITLYPNPTDGNITVICEENYDKLYFQLRNINGQLLSTQELNPGKQVEIELQQASGVYLLEITDQTQFRTVRRIVKK